MSFENCDYETRSIFVEGERVKYVGQDSPGLPVGSIGIVLWVYYWPFYEVTFTESDGELRDSQYHEDELSKIEPEAV